MYACSYSMLPRHKLSLELSQQKFKAITSVLPTANKRILRSLSNVTPSHYGLPTVHFTGQAAVVNTRSQTAPASRTVHTGNCQVNLITIASYILKFSHYLMATATAINAHQFCFRLCQHNIYDGRQYQEAVEADPVALGSTCQNIGVANGCHKSYGQNG